MSEITDRIDAINARIEEINTERVREEANRDLLKKQIEGMLEELSEEFGIKLSLKSGAAALQKKVEKLYQEELAKVEAELELKEKVVSLLDDGDIAGAKALLGVSEDESAGGFEGEPEEAEDSEEESEELEEEEEAEEGGTDVLEVDMEGVADDLLEKGYGASVDDDEDEDDLVIMPAKKSAAPKKAPAKTKKPTDDGLKGVKSLLKDEGLNKSGKKSRVVSLDDIDDEFDF